MKKQTVLVTGSSGLVGSEVVILLSQKGFEVCGIDNNMRADFFGPGGDTTSTLSMLKTQVAHFHHYDVDIRDRKRVFEIVKTSSPAAIIHCAAQPSHDLAKDRPFDDFEVNAGGTLNLLEAARQFAKESPFIFLSTNKVYGDVPNEIPLVELETRYEYSSPDDYHGVSEKCRIDQCLHSLFGASKAAADLLTQEYGRYFNMPTVCFRAGCITGARHKGVELHGFLNYLARVIASRGEYKIFGYKGKQVRDQIHSQDLVHAFECFLQSPRCGEVYNIGGGRDSNASLLESITMLEQRFNAKLSTTYIPQARSGDHICYISDTRKFREHYPKWKIEWTMERIVDELHAQLSSEQTSS